MAGVWSWRSLFLRSVSLKHQMGGHAVHHHGLVLSLDEGQRVEVQAWNADGTTEVRYRGTRWEAYALEGSRLEPGIWVIERTEGPRLALKPLQPRA